LIQLLLKSNWHNTGCADNLTHSYVLCRGPILSQATGRLLLFATRSQLRHVSWIILCILSVCWKQMCLSDAASLTDTHPTSCRVDSASQSPNTPLSDQDLQLPTNTQQPIQMADNITLIAPLTTVTMVCQFQVQW